LGQDCFTAEELDFIINYVIMYRMEKELENEEIFARLMNDDKMIKVPAEQVGKDVYNRIRK